MKVSGIRVSAQGLSFQLSAAREWTFEDRPKRPYGAGVAYRLEVESTELTLRLAPCVRNVELSLPSEKVLRRLARKVLESDYREVLTKQGKRSKVWFFIRTRVPPEVLAAFLGAVAFNSVIPEGYPVYE